LWPDMRILLLAVVARRSQAGLAWSEISTARARREMLSRSAADGATMGE
jgi:hypothetical protein